MPQIQNPTTKGSRVLWNALVGASTGFLSLSAAHAQYMIAKVGSAPDIAVMVVDLSLGGHRHG